MTKCLIIDSIHEQIFEILSEGGISADYYPEITRKEILGIVGGYDVLVVRGKTLIDREIIETGKNLKIVARAGSGLDILDVDLIRKSNIEIINSPEANRDAVGDHTIGMILSLMNKLHFADVQVREKIWEREKNRGYELKGKVFGIIGYGNMGSAVAERLQGFGCETLAYDKYKRGFITNHCKETSMEELFQRVDILSLHVPLTDETNEMLNKSFLQRFKKNIYLINTSRGKIAPMQQIVEGLISGKLLGAALDVLECEKLSQLDDDQKHFFNFLVTSDKTLLTPHVGGWSYESYEKISRVLGEKIVKFFK